MKPIKTDKTNYTWGESQEQYNNLPAENFEDYVGTVKSTWQLTFFERLVVLFTGKIFVSQWTFYAPLQPINITVNENDIKPVPADGHSKEETK